MGGIIRKRVFGHMRTAKAQMRAVWSEPSMSVSKIIGLFYLQGGGGGGGRGQLCYLLFIFILKQDLLCKKKYAYLRTNYFLSEFTCYHKERINDLTALPTLNFSLFLLTKGSVKNLLSHIIRDNKLVYWTPNFIVIYFINTDCLSKWSRKDSRKGNYIKKMWEEGGLNQFC